MPQNQSRSTRWTPRRRTAQSPQTLTPAGQDRPLVNTSWSRRSSAYSDRLDRNPVRCACSLRWDAKTLAQHLYAMVQRLRAPNMRSMVQRMRSMVERSFEPPHLNRCTSEAVLLRNIARRRQHGPLRAKTLLLPRHHGWNLRRAARRRKNQLPLPRR